MQEVYSRHHLNVSQILRGANVPTINASLLVCITTRGGVIEPKTKDDLSAEYSQLHVCGNFGS